MDALYDKTGSDFFAPNAHLPDFETNGADLAILRHLFIGDHFKERQDDPSRRYEFLIEAVKEFCPKEIGENHPSRIVKLLEILDTSGGLILIMSLPHGSLSAEHISKRSQVESFVIDFVDDYRELAYD